jgi:polyisoprenoid-binding protein YceI
MKTVQYMSVMILTMGLFLAGCAENPADNSTPSDTQDAFENSGAPIEGVTFNFSPDTKVDFVGSKVTGSHDGGFEKVSGSVVVPEGAIEKAQINVTIDMDSIWSDSKKLTGHLKNEDFFEVDTYPESSFTSTSIAKTDAGYEVKGNLTLHGVTKGITFPAQIAISEDAASLSATADFSINRMDFGVAYKGKADDLIRPEVVIKFDLKATAGV